MGNEKYQFQFNTAVKRHLPFSLQSLFFDVCKAIFILPHPVSKHQVGESVRSGLVRRKRFAIRFNLADPAIPLLISGSSCKKTYGYLSMER